MDICDFGLRLSGGLAGGGHLGAHRSLAAYLASSPFLPRLGDFAYQHHRICLLTMKARVFNFLFTLIIVCLAGWAAWVLYERYLYNPWTRDSQVRANVVGIAPRVSGPIIHVAVHDNQQVKAGDLLFEIDPADFNAQLDVSAGQVLNSEANLKQRRQDLDRQSELYKNHVVAQQDFQNAQDNFSAAQAQLVSAKANLELARLNLSYTKVFAPVNGYVTNWNTSEGTYVTAGKQLTALVDANSFWIAAYFKETQLPHIRVGQKANLALMGTKEPFQGVVRSIGWGIFVQDGSGSDATGLLPEISQTVDWVRLPQRFPVRIEPSGATPVSLRIGQTVSVALTQEVEPVQVPSQKSVVQP
jgi:multidrug resistance efflux pump